MRSLFLQKHSRRNEMSMSALCVITQFAHELKIAELPPPRVVEAQQRRHPSWRGNRESPFDVDVNNRPSPINL